jgi:hypothetical protein
MKIIFALLFIIYSCIGFAQVKPKPTLPKATIGTLNKQPILTATIANMTTGTYGVGAAKIMIDSMLTIKDEKGVKYTINRCYFNYKRKISYKNDETGEVTTRYEYLEKELKNNEQLDELWRQTIKEDLQKGEQLIFEKILVNAKKGGVVIPVKSLVISVK